MDLKRNMMEEHGLDYTAQHWDKWQTVVTTVMKLGVRFLDQMTEFELDIQSLGSGFFYSF
jgi:hypothetical protein